MLCHGLLKSFKASVIRRGKKFYGKITMKGQNGLVIVKLGPFISVPYRTLSYRTATDRLSFKKKAHHLNGFSVKNATKP